MKKGGACIKARKGGILVTILKGGQHGMRLNCGDTAPRTANYKVISPAGEIVGSVYMREGETLPPTDISGCHYELD